MAFLPGAFGIGGALRVSFARALLPEPEHGVPDPRDVPNRPPEGSEVRAVGAAGRALVGLAWPGLGGRRLASRRRVAALGPDLNMARAAPLLFV